MNSAPTVSDATVHAAHDSRFRASWVKSIVRYALHLFVLYELVYMATGRLPYLVYRNILPAIQRHAPGGNALQFLFSHILLFGLIPAFLTGITINARFRHGVARWVWIIPVTLLTLAFLLHGPGVYLTMITESDFGLAFHHFFGFGFASPQFANMRDFVMSAGAFQLYDQLHYTLPAYAGIAYSLGAWLGMSHKAHRLQDFMGRF